MRLLDAMLAFTVSIFLLAALIFYVASGGADLGGGVWDLLATRPRRRQQRDAITKAISPIWEADHVWLILVIVILFTAFPIAFGAMMTALHIPITLMLIGIILRGAGFIFRKYDSKASEVQQRWSTLFGAASFFTPLIQGITLGALSTGEIRVTDGKVTTGFFAGWLTPFAFVSGFLMLTACAFLAATYLTVDPAGEPKVRNDFRRRAIWSGTVLPAIVLLLLFVPRNGAPQFLQRLAQWPGIAIAISVAAFAVVALVSLTMRRFAIARVAAIAEVTLILIGWGRAQYPNLIAPDVTIQNSCAPAATLRLLIIALLLGAVILFPSLAFLYYLFKGKDSQPV
jgi:cytochrome d ubiquinol oxidase subunit II